MILCQMYLGDSVLGFDAVYICIETDISELISPTGADSRRVSQKFFSFFMEISLVP